jgi:hypothetical protein
LGISRNAIAPQKVDEKYLDRGGQGVSPQGMPPLWGSEGSPPVVVAEINLMAGKKGFFVKRKK